MDDMLQLQRPLCADLQFRLAHDISPDNYPEEEDEDDGTTSNQKEAFILSCLAQANANVNVNNNNNTPCTLGGRTVCDKVDKLTETFAQLEWKQNHFEKINNEINKQHLTKSLEDNNNHINIINNNVVPPALSMSAGYDLDQTKSAVACGGVSTGTTAGATGASHGFKIPRRPRKLPEIPKKTVIAPSPSTSKEANEKCLADELQEALVCVEEQESPTVSDSDDVFVPNSRPLPKVYPKFSGNYLEELKHVKFNTVSKNTRAFLNSDNVYLQEDSTENQSKAQHAAVTQTTGKERQTNGSGVEVRKSLSSFPSTSYQDLEVTHRGMHRFLPRHLDEMTIEIGDPIHVTKTDDDLWCEGVNLRTNQRGIFPSMYATDLKFLEEEDDDGCSKFHLRFLGSVEVNSHKGDEILCQAINKVALTRRDNKTSIPPPICTLEVSQYGIRMFDKSKTAHEHLDTFTHFFALKNISFCGYHPRNERYFGFITKHPNQYRYACHVFLGEKSTRSVGEALGQAFKRFYQEYMAFTHPTEDIYME